MDPAEQVGARVRAARRMAGIEQRKQLADLVGLPRFGPAVIGQIERGERVLYEHEAEALARVLPVDADFFYEAPGVEATQLDRIEARLATIEQKQDRNLNIVTRLLEAMDGLTAETVARHVEQAAASEGQGEQSERADNASSSRSTRR